MGHLGGGGPHESILLNYPSHLTNPTTSCKGLCPPCVNESFPWPPLPTRHPEPSPPSAADFCKDESLFAPHTHPHFLLLTHPSVSGSSEAAPPPQLSPQAPSILIFSPLHLHFSPGPTPSSCHSCRTTSKLCSLLPTPRSPE